MHKRTKYFLLTAMALIFGGRARAGPPFLTDDPEPVDYEHWEVYGFATGDRTNGGDAVSGPAFEANYGAFHDTQLHIAGQVAHVTSNDQPSATGLGDTELGVKYRFVHETSEQPQVGVFPAIELPTGDADRGLGNGRAWFRLPLWLQKSFGPWKTYGGGGVTLNSAPGQRDYRYGGWLVQRDFGSRLTLGGEIFSQGASTANGRGFTAFNFGGYFNFTENFSLLFSAGRSFSGERHTVWYLGLYRTGGK